MNAIDLESGIGLKDLKPSQSILNKIVEHQIDVDTDRRNNTWNSCCVTLDRRAVQYFTQVFIMVGLIIFSIAQLLLLDSYEAQQTYLGLLCLLIGQFMPQPKFKGNVSKAAN